jgi:2,5-furandicarboxylate decarboxylase 1
MYKDFRGFLNCLEENGLLVRVNKEVATEHEIAAGLRKICDTEGPALLFENVKGFPNWRVAGGVFATRKHIALALGLPIDADSMTITRRYLEFDRIGIKPKMVATGPCKEIIIKGDDIDLTKLPVPIYSILDSGRFISAGVEITKLAATGGKNVSIHRRKILSKNTTGLLVNIVQHLERIIVAGEKDGKGQGIATAVGADPEISIASQIKASYGVNEIEIAGALRGEPIEMVKCETIDCEVPASAEIIIEGVTLPGERINDGPFGEWPGNYMTMTGSLNASARIVKITAITMRKDAIFQAMITGYPTTENHALRQWAVATEVLHKLSDITETIAINPAPDGAGAHVIVSIRKTSDIDPRNVIFTLLGARSLIRRVTVVDEDIDVFNPMEVEWAVSTRMWGDRDIYVVPPVYKGSEWLTLRQRAFTKWGLDATMPVAPEERKWYQAISVPGVENVDYV